MDSHKAIMLGTNGRRADNRNAPIMRPQNMLVNHLVYQFDPSSDRQVQIQVVELGVADFFIGVGGVPATVKPAVPKKLVFSKLNVPAFIDVALTSANSNELTAFVEHLFGGSHCYPVSEHGRITSEDAISLVTKDGVCHLYDVFNVPQGVRQFPFHAILQSIVGTQFGLQQGRAESQKIPCVNILECWLNIPTRLNPSASLRPNTSLRTPHKGSCVLKLVAAENPQPDTTLVVITTCLCLTTNVCIVPKEKVLDKKFLYRITYPQFPHNKPN
jgi:hypothetical protein